MIDVIIPLSYENNRKKIIVCDDCETLRRAVKKLLINDQEIKFEYEVIEAFDGTDMILKVVEDQANGNLIEIIITDENMEYMSGSTAISIIREWNI